VETPPAEIIEVPSLPRAEPLSAPPSLVGSSVEGPTRLAAEVELGFEGDPGRIGIRDGSAMQRAFAFYAEELLADLRGAREP
jgi:hypothetical protein